MLTTALSRVAAAAAALTSTLALGLVAAAPASAAPATCDPGYPSSVQTTTSLHLARSIARYGSGNTASVRVSSDAGRPTGRVSVFVGGGPSFSVRLHSGHASVRLPRNLPANHTYTVAAVYAGSGCYAGSASSPKFYTVVRSHAHVKGLDARDIRVGGRPLVTGEVSGATGTVKVTIKHKGIVSTKYVAVSGGSFSAEFAPVRAKGVWKAVAVKPTSAGVVGDSAVTAFRVHR